MKLDQITQGHIQLNFEYLQGLPGITDPFPRGEEIFPSMEDIPKPSISFEMPRSQRWVSQAALQHDAPAFSLMFLFHFGFVFVF